MQFQLSGLIKLTLGYPADLCWVIWLISPACIYT